MAATGPTSIEELDSPRDVLEFARVRHLDADRADADVLIAAVLWAEQHPEESIGLAATWISGGDDTGLPLAGPGAPLVTCFCIAEFASAIGRSTDSGRAVIAAGVELKYRLPGTWHRVVTGSLQAWRARRIAEYTFTLSIEAAAFVDAQVSAFAHKIGVAQLERLVHVAMERFMPEVAREKAEKAADGRHIDFHHDHLTSNGTTRLEGELDLADALDLDAAITQGAEQLAACGSEEPLDPRRAMAAGELARRQLALDLATGSANGHADGDTIGDDTTNTTKTPKPRQVVLYLHLSEAAITGAGTGLDLARVENHRRGFTADQVRGWCANPDTQVTVKPVIDLKRAPPRRRLRSPRTPRGTDPAARSDLRVPLVQPNCPEVRQRALHSLRQRRHHLLVQHRALVSATSPVEDPFGVDLHHPRTRLVPVDQPPRLSVPTRPRRHPRRQPRPASPIWTTRSAALLLRPLPRTLPYTPPGGVTGTSSGWLGLDRPLVPRCSTTGSPVPRCSALAGPAPSTAVTSMAAEAGYVRSSTTAPTPES